MSLYDELYKNQRPTAFAKSDAMAYFLANKGVLAMHQPFERFLKGEDPFMVVRANIIIRSLINKRTIEKLYQEKVSSPKEGSLRTSDFMKQGLSDLPYLFWGGEKIYVPIFPSSLNLLYSERFDKLLIPPYKTLLAEFDALMIDPFDYYGSSIYDSYFTKLVAIKREGKLLAAYDFDAEALYIIDDEGRLDARLSLFDKYLPHPEKTHMVKRLLSLSDAYFHGDKEDLLSCLLSNGFMSLRLSSLLSKEDENLRKRNTVKEKIER